jgi:hypothetical protein
LNRSSALHNMLIGLRRIASIAHRIPNSIRVTGLRKKKKNNREETRRISGRRSRGLQYIESSKRRAAPQSIQFSPGNKDFPAANQKNGSSSYMRMCRWVCVMPSLSLLRIYMCAKVTTIFSIFTRRASPYTLRQHVM